MMAGFEFSAGIHSNKVFLANYSELTERFDPEMVLYNKRTKQLTSSTKPLKSLLLTSPQYGANESGITRNSIQSPRYVRITDINEYGNLIGGLGVTAETIEQKYILNNNDLLFARSGNTVGKAYLHKSDAVSYDCFFAGYMIRFVVDSEKILPDFLFLYTQLTPYKDWVKAVQRTAGQPNINAEEYKSMLIPLPDLSTQKSWVVKYQQAEQAKQQKEQQAQALLDSIDGYLLNELGITLPEQDNHLEKRMFTVPFSEVTSGRVDPYYFQEHFVDFFKSLKQSKYKVMPLSKVAQKITSGITPLSGGDAYTSPDVGIPFVRSGNIDIDGEIDFSDLIYLKPSIHNTVMKSSKLIKNDLMIAIVGATIGQVGIYIDVREANINQAIALVRLKESINHQYMKELIKSSIGQMSLNRLKRPVARANINLEEISTMQIILPPIEKQNEIASHINQIRIQAKLLQRDAAQLLSAAKTEIEQIILGDVA